MCFTGICFYENYDGECTVPMNKHYPEDALCMRDLDDLGWIDEMFKNESDQFQLFLEDLSGL